MPLQRSDRPLGESPKSLIYCNLQRRRTPPASTGGAPRDTDAPRSLRIQTLAGAAFPAAMQCTRWPKPG